ncbi:hypothetical protein [Nonomuraea sp. bgisy101]|uniref:hypothetical protein n=1 Tax=Nonomuraea sp. bgisy101 TaxID=3413784 RepID=UPI003D73F179
MPARRAAILDPFRDADDRWARESEKEAPDLSEAPSHLHLPAATISLYITHVIRRFGNRILNLSPPTAEPTTRLDLESRVLFAP